MEKTLNTINGWLEVLGPFGPWLLALLIIILGYFVATLVKNIVRRVLNRTSLDDKLANILGQDTDGCERGIATFVFWLLMLYVVVLALGVAGQAAVLAPLNSILSQILGFIPRLLAALAIGFVAWILATVAKNLIVGLLSAANIDERLGLGDTRPITNSVGLITFFGIILMLLPSVLDQLGWDEISRPIGEMVSTIFSYVPGIFAGIIIFAIGYLIASIVQKVLSEVLSSIGADSLPARLGYTGDIFGGRSFSTVVSYVAMATILVIITAQALAVMNLGLISDLARGFIPGYLKILVALVIFAAAFYIANIVGQLVEPKSHFWARVVRIAIIVFLGAVALQKANISDLTNETFQLIITSLIIAGAFAVGVGGAIALGLGGREKAARWLEKIK
ncbi:MAG: mechanosensitive ion channel [Verrucomicrobiales bacterium]|nr:mechanosensitive ion channel [Verrucomicrobiales bacterium]